MSDKEPGDILNAHDGETWSQLVQDLWEFPWCESRDPNPNQTTSLPGLLYGDISNPLSPPASPASLPTLSPACA